MSDTPFPAPADDHPLLPGMPAAVVAPSDSPEEHQRRVRNSESLTARLMAALPLGVSTSAVLDSLIFIVAASCEVTDNASDTLAKFTKAVEALLLKHAEWSAEQAVLAEANAGGGQ